MEVTEVITTYNRSALLEHNLERLSKLTKPDELVIVDDGSDDNEATEWVCYAFRNEFNIRYIYNDNPGPTICSMARNIGFREATHEHIVTCEPELIFKTDVIAQFKEAKEKYPNDVISTGVVYFAPPDWSGNIRNPPRQDVAVGWVAPHAALWEKQWVLDVGGWDENFPGNWGWDDTDLLTRIRLSGHGQYIDLGVEAIHQWHGYGADKDRANENYFYSKSFHKDETDLKDLVANK